MTKRKELCKLIPDLDNEQICKLLIVNDNDQNPFRSLIPFALKDTVLQKAILALAARHFANTHQNFHQVEPPKLSSYINADRAALVFKQQALKGLFCGLSDVSQLRKDVYLASIFLLIILDLHESGNGGWAPHLEGAISLTNPTRLLSNSTNGKSLEPEGVVEGIRDYFTKQIYL